MRAVRLTKRDTDGVSRAWPVDDEYEMEETVLGKGSFGEVVCGHDRKSGTTYAIKCLSKIRFPSDEEKEAAHLEAKIMERVAGHPHVVGMEAYLEDKANVYFVLECEWPVVRSCEPPTQ